MQRPFTSGSRQAPDPFDQFLEQNNFYRKHTARDSSCLFRVISEQMFDTQLHHLAIRKKCVRYMRKHHNYFQALVDRDLDEYLDDMSKPKTYGTLVELQAAGYMFQRNVLLFEPFNLGNFFSNRTYFNEVFRVFYTPERHFDSVFTCDYIKDAAMCQSICYEILYKDLYKLPDVSFAVEHMLHSPIYETDEFRSEFNEDGYCLRIEFDDGRKFDFDLPNDTNCILENYKLCHFHYTNFPRLSDDLQREMKINNNNRDEYDKNALCKTAESLLPNKYISCVRQLLNEGITPFPYKVAKALDPNMYRNIEFDAWNEHRKELKLQNWYSGDSNFKLIRCQQTRVHKIFQVGAKCHVKLCKSENDLYTCHIQEIAVDKGYCIVFIEQLGEKRMVPYDSLTPLPPDQFQPWSIPYRFQRQMQKYSSVRLTRHYNYRFKFNEQISSTHEYMKSSSPQYSSDGNDVMHTDDSDPKQQQHYAAAAASHHHRSSCFYKLKQYTHLENFRTHTVEYCTMPLTVEQMRGGDVDGKGAGGGGGGVGQRVSAATTAALTNENPSRAMTPAAAGVVAEVNVGVKADATDGDGETANVNTEDLIDAYDMDQAGAIAAGTNIPPGSFILPEFQCFYQMPPAYGMPEDYYSYSYDPNMLPPTTTFVPAGNGSTFYYYTPAANNIYMPGPVLQGPPTPSLISAAVPPTAVAGTNSYAQNGSGGGGYYHNPGYGGSGANPVVHAASVSATSSNSHNNTPSVVGRGYAASTTPLSGRVNMEAKKSVKPSGTDLPADVATLRHFYNLGLEYHNIIQKRKQEESIESWKDNVSKIMGDYRSSKADENGNLPEYKVVDSNNSSATNGQKETSSNPRENSHASNHNQTQSHYNSNRPSHPNRRFSSRYFNSNKDRQQTFQRNQQQQGGGGNINLTPAAMQQNRHINDYNAIKNNHVHNGKNANVHNGTPNVRHHHMQHQQNFATEQNIQTSPMIGYEAVNMGPAGEVVHTPHAYNSTPNHIISYGAYDYAADPNAMQLAPVPANASAASGVYIQMPMAAAPYGLAYAPPPPPPPMHTAASPGGQFHAPYMSVPPPPPSVAAANMAMHPPPTQGTNGFYGVPGGSTDISEYMNVINNDGIQCISYPPPMPFYYAPNTVVGGGGGGGGTPSNNGVSVVAQHQQPPPLQPLASPANVAVASGNRVAPPQAYWCAPPPNNPMPTPDPLPQPPSKGTTATSITQSIGDGSNNCNKTPNINGNAANAGICPQNSGGATIHRHREKQHQTTTTN